MKKPLKIALYILLALVLIVLAYVIYVFAAYYRVEDWQTLDGAVLRAGSHDRRRKRATDGERAADRRHLPRLVGEHRLWRVQRRLQLLHGRRYLLLGGEP